MCAGRCTKYEAEEEMGEKNEKKPLLLADGARCMERSRLVRSDVCVEGVKRGPV